MFAQAIRINYRISPWLFAAVAGSHLLAILSLFFTNIPSELKMLIALLVGAGFFHFYSSNAEKSGMQLLLNSADDWLMLDTNGYELTASLLPGSLVHSSMVVLRLRDKNHRVRSFILTPDRVDKDSLRRLRVRLRYPLTIDRIK